MGQLISFTVSFVLPEHCAVVPEPSALELT